MEALKSSPLGLKQVFQDSYIVPDYQRPYSWGAEECEQLFTDILSFYEHKYLQDENEYYFLGNIVVYPDKQEEYKNIIDGQQRITSLMLLTKALYEKDSTNKSLEKFLFNIDVNTEEINYEDTRLKTNVLDEHNEDFYNCIKSKEVKRSNNIYVDNYNTFVNLLKKYSQDGKILQISDKFSKFITMFIKNIKLLVIQCNDFDSSLNIFETLNNRGLPLTDSDIFKASLYKKAKEKKKKEDFLNIWKNLIEYDKDIDVFFRNYMHYLRAQDNKNNSETGIRRFFITDNKYLDDYSKVIQYLQDFIKVDTYLFKDTNDGVKNLVHFLSDYPNIYPMYPIYIFMIQNAKSIRNTEDGVYILSKDIENNLESLLIQMVKYSYIKGIAYNNVNAIKTDIYNICIKVFNSDNDLEFIKNKITEQDLNILSDKIGKNKISTTYRKPIVKLASFLHPEEKGFLFNNSEIEHILPKGGYNNYDGFTEEEYSEYVEKLGNLVPLHKKLNIKASNEYFSKKKEVYKDSKVRDVLDLLDYKSWDKKSIEGREKDVKKRLIDFLKF